MSVTSRFASWVFCLTTLFSTELLLAQPSFFMRVGTLPGGTFPSSATDISADGSVVVGVSRKIIGTSVVWESFRWTRAAGLTHLGELPGGQTSTSAYAVSADGSTVVGEGNSSAGREPFRWTQSTGIVGLGGLPGELVNGYARSVSANGEVVVGRSRIGASGAMAFRWSSATGMEALGDLGGTPAFSDAFDCSTDGNTIVGYSRSSNGVEAFRWRAGLGMIGLGDLPGGNFLSSATAITPSGDVIVGNSSSVNGTQGNMIEAYRWSEQTGMIGLGDLPTGPFESTAFDVSADGTVVVGASAVAFGYQAYIWRAGSGIQNLKEMLNAEFGLGLPGWQLTIARAVSDDGMTIVGEGVNPDGATEGWIAHMSDLPCVPADTNCDQAIDGRDVGSFVQISLSNMANSGCSGCAGDMNRDVGVDALDFELFVSALLSN